jgi:hypothetical protein
MTGTGYPDWQPPGYLGAKHVPGTGYPDWQPPGYVAAPAGGVVRLHQPFTEADWTEEYAFPFLTPEIKLLPEGGLEWTKAQAGTVAGILLLEEGKWIGSFQTVEFTLPSPSSGNGVHVGVFGHYYDTTHYFRHTDEMVFSEGVLKNFLIERELSGAQSKEAGKAIGGGWFAGNPKRWFRSGVMPGYSERSLWNCDPELPANAGRNPLQDEIGANYTSGGGTHVEPGTGREGTSTSGLGMYPGYAGSVGWVIVNPPAGLILKSYKATSMGLLP